MVTFTRPGLCLFSICEYFRACFRQTRLTKSVISWSLTIFPKVSVLTLISYRSFHFWNVKTNLRKLKLNLITFILRTFDGCCLRHNVLKPKFLEPSIFLRKKNDGTKIKRSYYLVSLEKEINNPKYHRYSFSCPMMKDTTPLMILRPPACQPKPKVKILYLRAAISGIHL